MLFIDEIHTLIGAAPLLEVLRCVKSVKASTIFWAIEVYWSDYLHEFRGVFEKDHALSRRFQKIDVTEPSVDQTIQILKDLSQDLRSITMSNIRPGHSWLRRSYLQDT